MVQGKSFAVPVGPQHQDKGAGTAAPRRQSGSVSRVRPTPGNPSTEAKSGGRVLRGGRKGK
jgi:hypothetical protein